MPEFPDVLQFRSLYDQTQPIVCDLWHGVLERWRGGTGSISFLGSGHWSLSRVTLLALDVMAWNLDMLTNDDARFISSDTKHRIFP